MVTVFGIWTHKIIWMIIMTQVTNTISQQVTFLPIGIPQHSHHGTVIVKELVVVQHLLILVTCVVVMAQHARKIFAQKVMWTVTVSVMGLLKWTHVEFVAVAALHVRVSQECLIAMPFAMAPMQLPKQSYASFGVYEQESSSSTTAFWS